MNGVHPVVEHMQSKSTIPPWNPYESLDRCCNLINGDGVGIMEYFGADRFLPLDAQEFINSQFKRFKVDPPHIELAINAWELAFSYIDSYDPYALFTGATDVITTTDPYYFQFSIQDFITGSWSEESPDEMEYFTTWDGYPRSWDYLMNEPGLKGGYFEDAYLMLKDVCESEYSGLELVYSLYGPSTFDMLHLGLWASLMWMSSPMAESWRATYHPVFDLCYQHGSCLAVGYTFYIPGMFRKSDRPAGTCILCGINEYCVELCKDPYRGGWSHICERCLHSQNIPGMSCGTRECSNTSCEHHPGAKTMRMMKAQKKFGELKKLPGSNMPVRELPGYMVMNQYMINHYATSIADAVGRELQRLISPN